MNTYLLKTLAILSLFLGAAFTPLFFGPGITTPRSMGAFLNGKFPDRLPSSWEWVNEFSTTGMKSIITVRRVPGTDTFVFGDIQGKLYTFAPDAAKPVATLVGDLAPDYDFVNSRYGLKGIAFHPEYGKAASPNRRFVYIAYMTRETKRRLSRFVMDIKANGLNLSSELVMIEQIVPGGSFHNTGELAFGKDGFLYVPFGDGHGGGFGPYAGTPIADTFMNVVQRIDHNLSGGIMRIDVDRDPAKSHKPRKVLPQAFPEEISGVGYWIPNDNPWLDTQGKIMEEYYSLGHRNPWKLTMDSLTGIPYVGEVGPHNGEELNKIEKGHNYGWPYKVGETGDIVWDRTPPTAPEPDPYTGTLTNPVFSPARTNARSLAAHLVYRGTTYPDLYGKILLNDVSTRKAWLVDEIENSNNAVIENLPVLPQKVYTIFEDNRGEISGCRNEWHYHETQ